MLHLQDVVVQEVQEKNIILLKFPLVKIGAEYLLVHRHKYFGMPSTKILVFILLKIYNFIFLFVLLLQMMISINKQCPHFLNTLHKLQKEHHVLFLKHTEDM